MRIRPWHLLVVILVLAVAVIAAAFFVEERPKDILLGVGTNLLSSVVFFLLLEIYWERMQRANGKRVAGFDYATFAADVAKSSVVRVMGTFVFPLTDDPRFADARTKLLAALAAITRRPMFGGIQLLFLDPDSSAAKNRAAEQTNYDVLACIRQQADTLREFLAGLQAAAGGVKVEVKLTSRMPPFALFQTDDVASLSFYFRNRPLAGVDSYTFFLDTPLGKFVERTFDDLWDDPRSVPLNTEAP